MVSVHQDYDWIFGLHLVNVYWQFEIYNLDLEIIIWMIEVSGLPKYVIMCIELRWVTIAGK